MTESPDISALFREGVETIGGSKRLAYELFRNIQRHHGEKIARRVFAKWAKPPGLRRSGEIRDLGLLDRLDLMKPKPVVQRLAKQLAEENKALPREHQRGAGGVDWVPLASLIRKMVKLRAEGIAAGTWGGPFPPDDKDL